MNSNLFLLFVVIFESCLLLIVFLGWFKNIKNKQKFTFELNQKPKFNLVKSDRVHVRQKTFIETPEVGVYLMRLFFVKKHQHLKTNSILYILKGKARVTMGNKTRIIKPGDFLYVPAKTAHHWEVIKPANYVEYLEFNSPSFAQTEFKDTIWL